MNSKKKITGIVTAIIVLLILFLIFRHGKDESPSENAGDFKNVHAQTIQKKDVSNYYEAAGTIQSKTISVISSRIIGTVTDILIKQGDRVTAGQKLLLIENNDLSQSARAAQAAYEEAQRTLETARSNQSLAETTYDRYKQLLNDKSVSIQEMDQVTNQKERAVLEFKRAEAGAEAAKANLDQAKVLLDFSFIRSPVDGVVTHKNIDKGSMATPGTPLLTVEDNSAYKVEALVDESMIGQITVSMPVDVVVDSIDRTFTGIVNEIVPSVDASSRTFVVKALITKDVNEGLLSNGLYARVLIPQKKVSLLTVPSSAIVQKGQLIGVYIINKDNLISYRMIRTGRTFGNDMEVLSGLSEGEKVVTDNVDNIHEGDKVDSGVSQF